MKKLFIQITGLSMTFLMISGCGSSTINIDTSTAVQTMTEKITFTDKFVNVDSESINRIYGVDESLVKSCAGMSGSGSTAECIAMWEANDESSAQDIEKQLNDFLNSYKEGYAEYKPEEVPKLESAILQKNGVYVVLCISADNETAKTVVNDVLKG